MKLRTKTKSAIKTQSRKIKRPRRTRAALPKGNPNLQKQIEALKRELREAREQQTATAEVLKVISTSPGDLEPVFQAILENATQICGAKFGILFRYEGDETFTTSALFNAPAALTDARRRDSLFRPAPNTAIGRMRLTKRPVHVADMLAEPGYFDPPTGYSKPQIARVADARTVVSVPMLKNKELVGAIVIYRQDVRPFTEKQITLVQSFAAQAVIAIENTRLLKELRQRTDDLSQRTDDLTEALEQQTATSEVLKVISGSPGDLQPVFKAMLENATHLCAASFGILNLHENDTARIAALHNVPPDFRDAREKAPVIHRPHPMTPLGRVIATKELTQIIDYAEHPAYKLRDPAVVRLVELAGVRTFLVVPMLQENELVGSIAIYRQEVRPFTDKQIELLKNFAAQAVIAIENTRLLNELRKRTDDLSEALDQQTATSEVLRVISSSPGDLDPVFQTMLESARRICGAEIGLLLRYDDGAFTVAAETGLPPAFAEWWKSRPTFRPSPDTLLGRVAATRQADQLADLAATPAYQEGNPMVVAGVELGGMRSLLTVPIVKDDELIGAIGIYRQEVRPFTDKQIELVTNFGAQAVIAIENTRLLNELRESLQQQTATSDVLKVISRSTFDLQAVLDALVESVARLCEADTTAIARQNGDVYELAATYGHSAEVVEFMRARPFKVERGNVVGRVVLEGKALQLPDVQADPEFTYKEAARAIGVRTMLGVPLLRQGQIIGVVVLQRRRLEPFSDKQIKLVSSFADQAVIAIENVRLFDEVQKRTDDLSEALEQQTATSEVLEVISSSAGELKPVFGAMLANATRICEAAFGSLLLYERGRFRRVAIHNAPPAYEQHAAVEPFVPQNEKTLSIMQKTMQAVHIVDMAAESPESPIAKFGGARSFVTVPMNKDGELIGVIGIYRHEVRPFSEKQIELLTNFAAQAVIAIENTRLLNELRQRTDDLTESLEYQTATGEILGVISKSPTQVQPVFDIIAASALRLCDATWSSVLQFDGETIEIAALHNVPGFRQADAIRASFPRKPSLTGATDRAVSTRATSYIPDVLALPDYDHRDLAISGGYRSILSVPMLRDGYAVGAITVVGAKPDAFSKRQLALLRTFADQAVIAIGNVRLFDEIQDKSRQLAEASQHKSQFLANMSHELRTPLNAILGYTELIIDGIYGETPEKAQAVLKRIESNGKHLLGLINDVLDLSKIEAGQLKLSLADYSIKDMVHNVVSAVEPLATKKKLNFKVEMRPDIPVGHGDEQKLTQVLLNLTGNALKFTDAGEVAIKVTASDGLYTVAIHDTGPGISAADQDKLFQQFQQADNSITKSKGGTGLGLAISKKIIELHGGSISVQSSVGHGSTFAFTLPLMVEQQVMPS